MQQIIFNLVSNAIKYTPSGGNVTISVFKEKNRMVISVKDNGIGIALKYHTKIFEKFVQFGSDKHSNGLGLTITNELVKLHKGKIFVRSKKGEGAEFIVNLPLRT